MPQGQCTLPPDESGRILDRLTGLEQIISPEAIRQALQASGRTNRVGVSKVGGKFRRTEVIDVSSPIQ